MPATDDAPARSRHLVTAVVVACDGARWLPEVLDSLAAQERAPDRLVALDLGSVDETPRLLAGRLGESSIRHLPRGSALGTAVAAGLAAFAGAPLPPSIAGGAAKVTEWVWIIHDDSAPDPGALRALLDVADTSPSAAVIGPKARGWEDSRVLVEVGVTVDRLGRRVTGLDRREADQGQHDTVRRVLAVGTAGMLIRRDVWDALDGFDPRLPAFGDDIDFGWRANLAGHSVLVAPAAVVRHAAALSTGRRRHLSLSSPPRRVARRHGIYVVLANMPLIALPLLWLRLLGSTLWHAVWFLATRRPRTALDQVLSFAWVQSHPIRLLSARRRRRRTRRLPSRSVRHLLAARGAHLRANLAGAADSLSIGGSPTARRVEGPTGHGSDEPELDAPARGLLRTLLWRPSALVVVALTALALVAEWQLVGPGSLIGGRLLPAPTGASDLWSAYLAAWHPVGSGNGAPAAPYLAVVAALSSVLAGKAWLAVDVLLLGAVPLAGLTAYLAAGQITRSVVLRVWAAAAYSLLPVVTGAIASGRVDVTVAVVLLPAIAVAAGRALVWGRFRAACAAALALSLAAAFAPVLYVIAAPLVVTALLIGLVHALRERRAGLAARRFTAAVVALVGPPALLMPWSQWLLHHPGEVLAGPGLAAAGLTDPAIRPWDVALLHPGGPALPPLWVAAPLIAGALAGLLRRSRRSLVYAGWALAAAGIGAGLVVARVTAPTGTAAGRQPGWPGLPTALAAVGLLIANLVAGEDARRVLSRHSFSWRQPIAVLAAGAAAAMPVAAAAAWVGRGAAHPLHRSTAAVLPAFVAADAGTGARPRTLVLRPLPDGAIAIAVVRADTPRFGDLDNVAAVPADPALVSAVHGLFAGQSNAAVGVLAQRDIRYLLAPSPSPLVTRALDAATDIEPVASGQGLALWQVRRPTARVSITSGNTVTALPSGAVGARAVLRPGPPGRRLLLAEAASSQWRVTVAGRPLPTLTTGGGLQGFALPESGGRLLLDRAQGSRPRWLWTELGVLVLLLFLAAPPTRRDDDRYLTVDSAEEQVADQPAPGADEPASAAAGSR